MDTGSPAKATHRENRSSVSLAGPQQCLLALPLPVSCPQQCLPPSISFPLTSRCVLMLVLFQVREVSSAAVEAAAAIQETQQNTGAADGGGVGDAGLPPALDSSIMDRVEALLIPTLKVSE